MAVLKVRTFPDEILSTACDPCGDDDVSAICNDLLETARAQAPTCVGLSANQIGYAKRVIAIKSGKRFEVYIDPEIIEAYGTQTTKEGCLSYPGTVRKQTRAVTILVKGRGKKSKPHKLNGLRAVIFQHEVDHLDGRRI